MEDLVPLLIFIVIAAVNFVKYLAEKGGKKPPAEPENEPADQKPSTIEEFFEEIERKFQPQPRAVGWEDWPEDIARPDYAGEMEDYEAAKTYTAAEVSAAEIDFKAAKIKEEPVRDVRIRTEIAQPRNLGRAVTFKIPAQGAVFSGFRHMRIAMPPLLRSETGHTRFELNSRKQLKRSIIASLVFSQPRAYDRSFDTTLAK